MVDERENNYQNIVIFFNPSTKLYDKSRSKSLFKRVGLHFFQKSAGWMLQMYASRATTKNVKHHSKYCYSDSLFLPCILHIQLIPFTRFFIIMLRWSGSFIKSQSLFFDKIIWLRSTSTLVPVKVSTAKKWHQPWDWTSATSRVAT